MLCLIICFLNTLCVRIQIDTIRNTIFLTCFYILFPFAVIVFFLIGTISTTNNNKIHVIILYFFPIDGSIMIADVNTTFSGSANFISIIITVISIYFFPGMRIAVYCRCFPFTNDQFSICISPAIFQKNFFLFFSFFYSLRICFLLLSYCFFCIYSFLCICGFLCLCGFLLLNIFRFFSLIRNILRSIIFWLLLVRLIFTRKIFFIISWRLIYCGIILCIFIS